jgi:excisionase family DNA binding protein
MMEYLNYTQPREEVKIMDSGAFLTSEQVAEILHIRADSLARKLRRKEIPGIKLGKRWLIPRSALEVILQPALPGKKP